MTSVRISDEQPAARLQNPQRLFEGSSALVPVDDVAEAVVHHNEVEAPVVGGTLLCPGLQEARLEIVTRRHRTAHGKSLGIGVESGDVCPQGREIDRHRPEATANVEHSRPGEVAAGAGAVDRHQRERSALNESGVRCQCVRPGLTPERRSAQLVELVHRVTQRPLNGAEAIGI